MPAASGNATTAASAGIAPLSPDGAPECARLTASARTRHHDRASGGTTMPHRRIATIGVLHLNAVLRRAAPAAAKFPTVSTRRSAAEASLSSPCDVPTPSVIAVLDRRCTHAPRCWPYRPDPLGPLSDQIASGTARGQYLNPLLAEMTRSGDYPHLPLWGCRDAGQSVWSPSETCCPASARLRS
jgi:hypothetical protein